MTSVLNKILGVKTFDDYIRVIHEIIKGEKMILRCQSCKGFVVKEDYNVHRP
jgi:hypothetical protein